MKQEIIDKLISLNRSFYEGNAEAFSESRDKHYWDNFDLILSDNSQNFTKLNRNNIYVIGNLSNSFLNKKDIKILDVGCGNGRVLEYLMNNELLKDKNVEYSGIDFSKKFLEITKNKILNNKNIFKSFKYELIEIDITIEKELKKLDRFIGFDLIISVAVMHHIPSHELRTQISNYLKSILNKNGRIFLTTWNFIMNNSSLVVEPKSIGINKSDLESCDHILTWKNLSYRYLCLLDSPSEFS